ncbi:hypothetical protein [Halosimplex halobium]|uniref:hypothetical protein n=1 Tax=Halosimplex halobium TaxID=3396618 RepID=UPI003F55861B
MEEDDEDEVDYLEVHNHEENDLNTSVRVRLNSDTKLRWERYAENTHGINGISELVRGAVSKEISGGFEDGEQKQDQILEGILEIKDSIDEAHEEVRKTHADIIDESKLEATLESAIDASTSGGETDG